MAELESQGLDVDFYSVRGNVFHSLIVRATKAALKRFLADLEYDGEIELPLE